MSDESLELAKKNADIRKLEIEVQIKELELELKEVDLQKRKSFVTPVLATIIVAFIGFFGTAISSYMQKSASIEVEKHKLHFSI